MTKMYKELEAENVDLKRKTSRGRGSTKTVLDATDRQLLDEAKQGMREVSRHVKFQKPGWLSFSMRVGTVCQMVVRKISWQPGMKEKDYMNSWYNVLVPHLPGVLQDLKNKMTQKYRGQHESKTVAYDCLVELSRILTLLNIACVVLQRIMERQTIYLVTIWLMS